MSYRLVLVVASLVLGLGSSANAQSAAYPAYPAYPVYYGGGGTVAGSAATGAANVINAQGSYNLQSSQAAINLTQARSMNLDNQLKYTQTYYEQKSIHDQYMQAQYDKDRRSVEAYQRYKQSQPPKRMSYSELDPVTGHISWPPVLTTDEYGEQRQNLDKLFADRAKASGAIGYNSVKQIRSLTEEMTAEMKKNISTVPPDDYIAGTKFLSNLANEARYPVN